MFMISWRTCAWFTMAAALVGCGGGGGGAAPRDSGAQSGDAPTPLPDGNNAATTITGRVTDAMTGTPISGVAVTPPGGTAVVTDADGHFTVTVSTSANAWVLAVAKTGYASTTARVTSSGTIAAGAELVTKIAMKAVSTTVNLDSSSGGTINDPSGAQVVFPAGAFVTKAGAPVSGTVTVNVTPINPFDPVQRTAFPGSYGASKDGMTGQLRSYALMDISATAGGQALTLASGTTADVTFPIDDSIAAPDTIDLWSLDESTGTWKLEGTATRVNIGDKRYYKAQLTHLSWWNCDHFQYQFATVTGQFTTDDAVLKANLANASVTLLIQDSGAGQGDTTFFGSAFSVIASANGTVVLRARARVTLSNGAVGVYTSEIKTIALPGVDRTIDAGAFKLVPDFCGLFNQGYPCNDKCVSAWYTSCPAGSDPQHPCATDNGGCDSHRACAERTVSGQVYAVCGACGTGYIATTAYDCKQLQCPLNNGNCVSNATCTDITTGVTCACKPGYPASGSACVDPCATNNGGCDAHATCGHDASGKTCTCKTGYTGNGTACAPTCSTTCGSHATCTAPNTCTCDGGYMGDGQNCCSSACGTHATCSGPDTCTCTQGYTGDGLTCAPVCTSQCGSHATCTAPDTCACDQGYAGDGSACTPRCTATCDPHATCSAPNTCTCNQGYAGNGTTCMVTTAIDLSTQPTGTDVVSFGSLSSVRALEFHTSTMVTLGSVRVDGLSTNQGTTAKMWIKSGAINLQVTDMYALGSPHLPTATTSTSATFDIPLQTLVTGTYSMVFTVDDQSQNGEWQLRQIDNSSPSVAVGPVTLDSVWGWHGDLDAVNNMATSVSIYDQAYFIIPKVTLTFVGP